MVDAADSKSATCEGVGVQVPSPVYSYGSTIIQHRQCSRGVPAKGARRAGLNYPL
jgi:hypothetical protein